MAEDYFMIIKNTFIVCGTSTEELYFFKKSISGEFF